MSDQLGFELPEVTRAPRHLDRDSFIRLPPEPNPEPEPDDPFPVRAVPEPPVRAVDQLVAATHPDITDAIDASAKLFEIQSDPTLMEVSSLAQYIVPPFTFFDTRQGYWQERRRQWLAHGIQSEVGRDGTLTYGKFSQDYLDASTQDRYGGGSTSVFDPVLTELVYHWFCPCGGVILDPFAGGSVRGIVAASRQLQYIGVELRKVQVEANIEQGKEILASHRLSRPVPMPMWIEGDSDKILDEDVGPVDLIFSCPPYADLEVYSDDPRDLSRLSADAFDVTYTRIIGKAARWLRDDRFAIIVISNIRTKAGYIRDLVGLTTHAFGAAGMHLYNEATLLNVAGTAPIRAGKQFAQSRKLVKVDQRVLVYLKGDPRKAASVIENGGG